MYDLEKHGEYRERYPVGDYVFSRMSQSDKDTFVRFMRQADGHDEGDDAYCAISNAGVTVPGHYGPIDDRHIRLMLEMLSKARLLQCGIWETGWRRILRWATGHNDEAMARIAEDFATASGISDEEAFDEDERSERIEAWEYQRDRARALGLLGRWDDPPAPALPALLLWAQEGGPIPAVHDDGEQLSLDVAAR